MGNDRRDALREARYTQAVEQFGSALERLAAAYERDADRRLDLIQDIHVALWRSFVGFDGRCSLRTWVYRVAHNTATSLVIRRQAARPVTIPIEDAEPSLVDGASLDQLVERRLAVEHLMALIHQLRPVDRQVILLYLEGLDAAAIAEIVGMSPANVATRIGRIKKVLARQFHGGMHEE